MCSFCASLFMKCGRTPKTCSTSSKLEPPCRSCVIFQHSHVLKADGDQYRRLVEPYIITLFFGGELVLFNCHHGNVLFDTLF